MRRGLELMRGPKPATLTYPSLYRRQRGFGDFGLPRGDPSQAWRAHWTRGKGERPGRNEKPGVP